MAVVLPSRSTVSWLEVIASSPKVKPPIIPVEEVNSPACVTLKGAEALLAKLTPE